MSKTNVAEQERFVKSERRFPANVEAEQIVLGSALLESADSTKGVDRARGAESGGRGGERGELRELEVSGDVGQRLTVRSPRGSRKVAPRAYWACGFRGPMYPAIAPDFTERHRLGWTEADVWGATLRIPGEEDEFGAPAIAECYAPAPRGGWKGIAT